MPHPKMMEHLKRKDTLKLFAAFSQLGPEDPPTAVAAMGCIAMGVADKEVGGTGGTGRVVGRSDTENSKDIFHMEWDDKRGMVR